MAPTRSLFFPIVLTTFLLSVDAVISLALVSSMVYFLQHYGGGPFIIAPPDGPRFLLAGEPANLVVNQGHTANAAGGTALILVGFGGILALSVEWHSREKRGKSSPAFYIWAVIVLLSFLLTMAALIYTFVETSNTSGQVIHLAVAEANSARRPYPDGRWTPENWYAAVLDLPLLRDEDRDKIGHNLNLMRGWRWNLVPLFILGFVLLALVALELWRQRRTGLQRVSTDEAFHGPSK
ncbi:hypothetical protein NEMBOFW57_010898 [Staphylotrichum longicolle]|uniref:Uncharacterized protein n=1 Tax=Staphylotrichum longicolle TaxID=669026 RepID=A0AAD4HXG1_9PEZI|nr:hypothetical protein NEMBOFW57_010898 [Staphylotrichum longicolle]